ncbi:hypothetical protein SISNIDRAFT_486923 [Sistotremastrum niveocremeum HHB9708]|uniref:Uncharacterized protein n=1 Tax=Sistotremastrum niveocremeum HHB9708 TaxID=1314777 RepID=A0A164T193_9AGAM|nr:hypothetical protein SISNIDRAFT_486923 [Sistotremastrum niveocremeum HHB9708]
MSSNMPGPQAQDDPHVILAPGAMYHHHQLVIIEDVYTPVDSRGQVIGIATRRNRTSASTRLHIVPPSPHQNDFAQRGRYQQATQPTFNGMESALNNATSAHSWTPAGVAPVPINSNPTTYAHEPTFNNSITPRYHTLPPIMNGSHEEAAREDVPLASRYLPSMPPTSSGSSRYLPDHDPRTRHIHNPYDTGNSSLAGHSEYTGPSNPLSVSSEPRRSSASQVSTSHVRNEPYPLRKRGVKVEEDDDEDGEYEIDPDYVG